MKTKNNKFYAMGNIEKKFQENFYYVFNKEFKNNEKEDSSKKDLVLEEISKEMLKQNRHNIFKIVISFFINKNT